MGAMKEQMVDELSQRVAHLRILTSRTIDTVDLWPDDVLDEVHQLAHRLVNDVQVERALRRGCES